MKEWLSARDIAEARLPGLPARLDTASRWIALLAERAPHLVRKRQGRGGGLEVHRDAVPVEAREEAARRAEANALIAQQNDELVEVREVRTRQIGAAVMQDLNGRQRQVMEARAAFLMEIERRTMQGGRSRKATIAAVLAGLRAGHEPSLSELAGRASDRPRAMAGVSPRTVLGWFAARDKGGLAALAPMVSREKEPLPSWFEDFARGYYAKPTKPPVTEALDDYCKSLPAGTPRPSIDQVRRCRAKLSVLEQARGREGKVAIRRLQAYVSRDTSALSPTSIYVADGTTYDQEVAHPVHGRPFKPEITSILDVATRACVGWSAGLSESTWVVADALRRAVGRCGVPAIFYSDRGPGYRNAAMDAPLTGIVSRLGCEHHFARPRNAQAKGNVERFQKLWVKVAKRRETYTGAGMDREAKLLAFKTTRREIALFGASRMLPDWADFVWAIEDEIHAYNHRPHRGLPKIRDPQTGRQRHASPAEAWAAHVAKGFEAIVPEAAELEDMFRPYEERRVSRCLVQLNTNSYFSNALEDWHGRDVVVGYDIADGQRVWIREIDIVDGERVPGRLICTAEFEGNKRDYVPLTTLRRAEEKRFAGRMRRAQDKIEEIEAEFRPSLMIEAAPVRPAVLSGVARAVPAAANPPAPVAIKPEKPAPRLSANGRPIFGEDEDFALWITAHPDQVNQADRDYIRSHLLVNELSRSLLAHAGVDIDALRDLTRAA